MQIFIGSTAYDVDAGTSVESLKSMIENKEFIPAGSIRLTHEGRVLDFGSLEGNGIAEEDELVLGLEAPAGMRAKWRKKRVSLPKIIVARSFLPLQFAYRISHILFSDASSSPQET